MIYFDLIERLRARKFYEPFVAALLEEAADEIERLRDRNEVLEQSAEINRKIMDSYGPRFDEYDNQIAKLQAVVDAAKYVQSCIDRGCHSMETVPDLREALAALENNE